MRARRLAPGERFALAGLAAWSGVTALWWGLAFAPLPAPAVWLARARAVCFGTLPNGLPDTWGWGGLVVSPLAVLGVLVAVWGRDLGRGLRTCAGRPAGRAVLAASVLAALLGAGWVAARVAGAAEVSRAVAAGAVDEPLPDDYPRQREAAPALGLIDQSGRRLEVADLRGRPVVVTFAFGHCRTVCPVVVRTARDAAGRLADLAPALVVVSLDPWRDTPSSLASLHAGWELDGLRDSHVLSGSVDEVLAALERWNMPIQRDPLTGEISHPALVCVLAPDGTLAYSFSNPPVSWVTEAARRVAAPSPATTDGSA